MLFSAVCLCLTCCPGVGGGGERTLEMEVGGCEPTCDGKNHKEVL